MLCLRAQNYSQHNTLGGYHQLIRVDVSVKSVCQFCLKASVSTGDFSRCLDLWKDGERIQGNIHECAYIACISLKAFLLGLKQAYCWRTAYSVYMSIYNYTGLF